MRPGLAFLAAFALLGAALPAFATDAVVGDYLRIVATGPNLITRPDGQVVVATVPFAVPGPVDPGVHGEAPSSVAWCLLGFPTPCAPRYEIPAGLPVSGVWKVQVLPDVPAGPYALEVRLAGWFAPFAGAVDCGPGQLVTWSLDVDARSATPACGGA